MESTSPHSLKNSSGAARGNPILAKFRAALNEMYGERIERVVLYGSRARRCHSDYDIAVFIKDPGTFTDDSERLATITTDILVDTGAVISATPFPPELIATALVSCTSCARMVSTYEGGRDRQLPPGTRLPIARYSRFTKVSYASS